MLDTVSPLASISFGIITEIKEKSSLLMLKTALVLLCDFPRLAFFPYAGSTLEPGPLEWGGPTFHSSQDLLYMFPCNEAETDFRL